MDTPIMFTPAQLVTMYMGFCGAIVAGGGAFAIIYKIINKAKEPNAIQNKRLDEIEKKLEDHAEYLNRDNKRLGRIEEGDKIILRALNALLRHGIDGNDINGMKEVHKDLESYLINKA